MRHAGSEPAAKVGGRLRAGGLSARTVTIKVRHHDFTTITRSTTRPQPTDQPRLIAQLARRLLAGVDTSAGIRLLGVGVTALADFVQDDLFGVTESDQPSRPPAPEPDPGAADQNTAPRGHHTPGIWRAGQDLHHDRHGPGWVWGSGGGLVTVRFEGPTTPPGPVRTFDSADAALRPADPPEWAGRARSPT